MEKSSMSPNKEHGIYTSRQNWTSYLCKRSFPSQAVLFYFILNYGEPVVFHFYSPEEEFQGDEPDKTWNRK